MIEKRTQIKLLLLSSLASITALVVAAYSLLNPEVYLPSTPKEMLPGAVSQDTITIASSVLLLACAWLIRHGKPLAWLIWLGLLGYLYYAYTLYSYEQLYNELFLGYLAIMGFSLYAIIGFLTTMDISKLRLADPSMPPPRKLVAALFLLLTLLFSILWLSLLLPAMRTRIPPHGSTIVVMDLSVVLPLLVWSAYLLTQRRRAGDLLAVVMLIKAGTVGLSVLLGTLISPLFDLPLDIASIGIYSLLGLTPLLLIRPFLKRLTIDEPNEPSAS